MNFASDNVYGVHPKILAALSEANAATAPSYGGDELTRKSEEKLAEIFGCELRAFLVTTGTAANGLSLSSHHTRLWRHPLPWRGPHLTVMSATRRNISPVAPRSSACMRLAARSPRHWWKKPSRASSAASMIPSRVAYR